MAFSGWPDEAVEFYEGLEADNTRAYWQDHRATYRRDVKGPMEALLAELAGDFGPGRLFRPYRDVRFSRDKSPYKLNCAAHLPGGYISFSADGLFVGSGLYRPTARAARPVPGGRRRPDHRLEAAVDGGLVANGRLRRRRPRGSEGGTPGLPQRPSPGSPSWS